MNNKISEWIKRQEFPRNDLEKQLILQEIMKDFEENKIYNEQEINQTIKKYYDDSATIRRELVNFGYMQRNEKLEYKVIMKKLSEEQLQKIGKTQNRMEKGNVY